MKILGIIFGFLIAIGGGYCVVNPAITLDSLTVVLAISLIEAAILSFVLWFKLRKNEGKTLLLINGIISAIAGVGLLTNYFAQFVVVNMIISMSSVIMTATGISLFVKSLDMKKVPEFGSKWIVLMVMAILVIISGIVSIFNPAVMGLSIGIYIGVEIMMFGMGIVVFSLSLK